MISRQDLLAELVAVGVALGTARSRLTRATQQLTDEERITPQKGVGKEHNKLYYTAKDADLIRERLGLHAAEKAKAEAAQTQTEKTLTEVVVVPDETPNKTPPEADDKKTPEPSEDEQTEKEGETTQKEDPLNTKKAPDTPVPTEDQTTPSTRSIKDLANTEGPQQTETKKPEKTPEKQPAEKKTINWKSFKPNWLFFIGGALALVGVAWYLMKKKPKGEDKKQPEGKPVGEAPVNLADQYRL